MRLLNSQRDVQGLKVDDQVNVGVKIQRESRPDEEKVGGGVVRPSQTLELSEEIREVAGRWKGISRNCQTDDGLKPRKQLV